MNSIFKKNFLVYTASLVFSFMLLAVFLSQAINSFFVDQKKQQLISQGQKIYEVFKQAYYKGGLYDKEKLENEIIVLDTYLDASFFYVDSSGKVVIVSNDIDAKWLGQTVSSEVIDDAVDGSIISIRGTMNGMFESSVFTVGYPIIIDGYRLGAIFMNSPMTELHKNFAEIIRFVVIFMAVAVLVGFILIFIFSKKTTQPIMEMNEIAKIISNGDFERRIDVNTNDEVGQLAHSFNNMAESLNKQEVRRKEFISNISHDLRSPITSIRGFIQAMLDGVVPPEENERYMKIILDEVDRLTKLVNNIIEMNKADEMDMKLNVSEFNINELIKKTAAVFEGKILEKGLHMMINFAQEETRVRADYDKIQRIISNLIDNAIKFTDKNGVVTITTTIKDRQVFISVKDTGVGISEQEQKRIFERFYKTDASRGLDKHGNGIGLSIVKEFIKAHHSRITVKSDGKIGSEFEFFLNIIE